METNKKRCENYSVENKQCKFNYIPHPYINDEDLNPRCDGFKDETQCAWFIGYHLDIAGNSLRMRKYREMIRNGTIHNKT